MDSVQCSAMTFRDMIRPAWTLARPAVPVEPSTDTTVTVATFLGAGDTTLLPVGVQVLPGGLVVVAGNGHFAFGHAIDVVQPIGEGVGDNATLLVLDAATGAVVRVAKIGGRVDHVRANGDGSIAVAGSFGVAVLASAVAKQTV